MSPPSSPSSTISIGANCQKRITPFRHAGVLSPWLVRPLATGATATVDIFESRRRRFKPSPEQKAIVEAARTQNVVVSARPGSGKTATAEAIVAANAGKKVLLITYSKRLQLETARRLEDYPGCDVYTFHGLAGRLFNTVTFNDAKLRELRREGSVPLWSGEPYDIIILDELQDCTDDLFWLICVLVSSVTHAAGGAAPKIVALGDERQAIYAFRGADARYLSLVPSTMAGITPYPWTHMTLSKSFRLSHQTARFVNDVFLGGDKYVVGTHDGPKPSYLHADLSDVDKLARKLVPLILEYGPEQSAILAPFVRGNTMLSRLTNLLSKRYGIHIAVSVSDDMPLDDLVIGGKLCVSTYHQFKGNERDLVIVYGVDAGYFEFLGRNLPDDTCPNETFVALTRATKKLVVLQGQDREPMPFISLKRLRKTAQCENLSGRKMLQPRRPGRPLQLDLLLPTRCAVSDMARHVPDEDLEAIATAHLRIEQTAAPLRSAAHIEAPDITLTDAQRMHYEAVSDINGLAVVAAFEHAQTGSLTTLGFDRRNDDLDARGPPTDDPHRAAAWFCRQACRYEAQVSGYESRSLQMRGHAFDWLAPHHLDAARERLAAQIVEHHSGSGPRAKLQFEARLADDEFRVRETEAGDTYQQTRIRGRADIVVHHHHPHRHRHGGKGSAKGAQQEVDKASSSSSSSSPDVTIWEIKFVAKLSLHHAIQAATYGYLWARTHGTAVPPRIVLFNVRDGERWEVSAPGGVKGLRAVVEAVLRAKYTQKGREPTDAFLEKCARAREEVEGLWRAAEERRGAWSWGEEGEEGILIEHLD